MEGKSVCMHEGMTSYGMQGELTILLSRNHWRNEKNARERMVEDEARKLISKQVVKISIERSFLKGELLAIYLKSIF